MRSFLRFAVALLVVSSIFPRRAFTDTVFALGFAGPDVIEVEGTGTLWSVDLDATLSHAGDGDGAQGWSVSLTADAARITRFSFDDSQARPLWEGGFKKTELTTRGTGDCADRDGAVGAIVLSFTEARTLPPNATTGIGKLMLEGAAMVDSTPIVRYVDGCRGSGTPVTNAITQAGNTIKPVLGSKGLSVRIVESCCFPAVRLNVGFSSEKVSSPIAYDRILDSTGTCAAQGELLVESLLGEVPSAHVYANISSREAGGGVQGWSFAIRIGRDIERFSSSVTTAGTSVDKYFSGGFNKTEFGESRGGNGYWGVVSAVVLSFVEPITLPPTGTETVLDIHVQTWGALDDTAPERFGLLFFASGLPGSGQPVMNAVTVEGATQLACNFNTASVSIVFRGIKATHSPFIRGNANNDDKVNLADAVWIINELFRSGPTAPCQDAADTNDDGFVDSADAVYIIDYLFRSGSAPPSPFPVCGDDPTAEGTPRDPTDDLNCPLGSATGC